MNKLAKYIVGLIAGMLMMGMSVCAAEYTVTDASAVLYTTEHTVLCSDADESTAVIPITTAGLPIQVTGVTSNGYFRIALDGQIYYVAGAGLDTTGQQTAESVQQSGKKYTCVMEEGDKDYLLAMGYNPNFLDFKFFERHDYTDNPIYVCIRNQLELGLQRKGDNWKEVMVGEPLKNEKVPALRVTGTWTGPHGQYPLDLCDNLLIDMAKAYPNIINRYPHIWRSSSIPSGAEWDSSKWIDTNSVIIYLPE